MRKTSSTLIALVLFLLCLGIAVLASSSSVRGSANFDDPQYFLKRQLVWLLVALVVGVGCAKFDYHYWKKFAILLYVVAAVLLAAVFIPGIGLKVGGSYRWIRLGPLTLQSSEVAKFALVVGLAAWIDRIGRRITNFLEGLLYPAIAAGMIVCLILAETDLGTSILLAIVFVLMLFVAGTRLSYLVPTAVLAACALSLVLMQSEVRWKRMLAFMHPDDPEYAAKAYHLTQSKIAFINGGWFGVGLGNSIQKQLYLPEAHTDFIFAIIGEELGFIMSLSVVLVYIGILVCGMIISLRAKDTFGKLLAFGLIITIVSQAFINIAVATGSAPTKGIALPFISYGGSSLLIAMASICVLLNIAGHCDDGGKDRHTRPIKDRMRGF